LASPTPVHRVIAPFAMPGILFRFEKSRGRTMISMRTLQAAMIVLASLSFGGCGSYVAKYSLGLVDVIEPADGIDLYAVSEIDQSIVSARNELFHVRWRFDYDHVGLILTNRSHRSLRIHWDECVFIGPDNNVSHVVPGEIRYGDVYDAIKPAKIPSRAAINAIVFPRNRIVMGIGGWTARPFLPQTSFGNRDWFNELVESYAGSKIQFVLAIEHDGRMFDYHYVFEITQTLVARDSFKIVDRDRIERADLR
jgi:hypothetical protein